MLSFAELEFKWFFHVVGSVNQVHVICYVHVKTLRNILQCYVTC